MIRKLSYILLLTLSTSVLNPLIAKGKPPTSEIYTIYLVRHSEKDFNSTETSDLPLSICGEKRSASLMHFLQDINLEAIYSTDYSRTKHTALPTAESKDLEITIYSSENLLQFSEQLISNKQDALVVGHSNTTAVLAGLLINREFGDIDLHIYDRIYQVTITGESRKLQLLHSPFECNK